MTTEALARIETKLRAARTQLVLDRPFIGALVLHLPLEAAPWCESLATDARSLYFNPRYIDALTLKQTQFVLAHEAMHCALGHFARRAHRVLKRWDVACDHAVNILLADEGLEPPPGALLNREFRGLAAEEIYPLIHEDTREKTLDRHLFDRPMPAADGAGMASMALIQQEESSAPVGSAPPVMAEDESWDDAAPHARSNPGNGAHPHESLPALETLAQTWRMRLASAAHQARHAGRLSESWQRLLERFIEPKLPWRSLLARYLLSCARDDYSFERASRREGDALLPRLHSGQVELFVILDTSGSVGDEELRAFATEVDALKAQVRARVTLHACDSALAPQGPWIFQAWEPVVLPERFAGGGGTDFAPVFEWIARESLRPDVLVYFTDADGTYPPSAPPFPVIWLVKGRAEVPWGERIQLN